MEEEMFILHFGTLNVTLLSKIGACLFEEMDWFVEGGAQ